VYSGNRRGVPTQIALRPCEGAGRDGDVGEYTSAPLPPLEGIVREQTRPVSWLEVPSLPSRDQVPVASVNDGDHPLTVAGPRRYFTGLPGGLVYRESIVRSVYWVAARLANATRPL
jgi:hypothetical protein